MLSHRCTALTRRVVGTRTFAQLAVSTYLMRNSKTLSNKPSLCRSQDLADESLSWALNADGVTPGGTTVYNTPATGGKGQFLQARPIRVLIQSS
jgi:hypothetical protein